MATAFFYVAALLFSSSCTGVHLAAKSPTGVGHDREAALLQTWGQALDSGKAADTPVTRVVKLLKEMGATLQKEMDEDEKLYDKLACWCNSNKHEKTEAIAEHEAKVSDLSATIDGLTAKSSELKTAIDQLEADAASGKSSLATSTELREKEASEFHGAELESIQAIENLKAAIEVLAKHHGAALPQMSLMLPSASFLAVRGRGRKGRDVPWEDEHESRLARSFDDFLQEHGFVDSPQPAARPLAAPKEVVLASQTVETTWTDSDTAAIKRALRSAATFMQARHGEDYYPSYQARSGEIMGLLKELKEQMEGDLSESQKTELARKAAFEELRASKQAEIEAAEKQAEQKEDELATASMNLAEAKEDLSQTSAALSEDQQFALNLKTTCEDADANFEQRKNARLQEIQAVSDAIGILAADDARDTMSRTYAFIQLTSYSKRAAHSNSGTAAEAAAILRRSATKLNVPELSVMASRVELDSFTRVKKAIDDMVKMLEVQQADEVKKHDWCNSNLHENEVTTAKTEDRKADLSTKIDELGATMQKFGDEASAAKARVAELQVDLQRANENRQKENVDFQATIADQRATQAVLKQALKRLAEYYSQAELVQTSQAAKTSRHMQTPPVPQMDYKPSTAGTNVMSLLEKLIQEAKALETESLKGENSAQLQYEALIADTNAAVKALQAEVAFKSGAKADASKEKTEVEGDLVDTVDELAGLDKYKSELHSQCDYLVKNFATRQEARAQEVEALKQAKQILSGADLS